MYLAGIEPVTLVTAELRSNCSAIEQTDIHCGKMPIHTTFLGEGGGAKMTLFKRWECFFLQIRPHWLLTTKSSILMYSAGIEPVILVMAELRSSRSANETDGAYRKKGQYIQTLGGGRNSRG